MTLVTNVVSVKILTILNTILLNVQHYLLSGIKNWWHVNLGCTFNLNAKDVIFGICNAYDNAIFEYINYFILMAKYYIMKCRKRALQIQVQDFIHYMKYKLEVEILHYSISGMKETELSSGNTYIISCDSRNCTKLDYQICNLLKTFFTHSIFCMICIIY